MYDRIQFDDERTADTGHETDESSAKHDTTSFTVRYYEHQEEKKLEITIDISQYLHASNVNTRIQERRAVIRDVLSSLTRNTWQSLACSPPRLAVSPPSEHS